MHVSARIELALDAALALGEREGHPPKLAQAMRHAVFPGGARIRPTLCLAVAAACGDDHPALADAMAASIELLHCASLVHDDLPCFDDAPTRRGQPSVHRAFGERLAVLAGDALIVLAFETLGRGAAEAPGRLPGLVSVLAAGVGMPCGIAAGQAWECEPRVVLGDYHRAKTGALFAAAAAGGALAAGADARAWRVLGEQLGEAYQVADDIRDSAATAQWLGKPSGRDLALDRPNITREQGLRHALGHFADLIAQAQQSVPPCRGATGLRRMVQRESERLVPKALLEEWLASAA
ncbi:polyprenyl synthetase family protein [Ideonella sp. DXS29W]|uniref:Polyprenyl synthetase family protein n=1 Tax=Ideonella lacteola TaxID=2984193 RepID=A0ABU9BMS5_9BURK